MLQAATDAGIQATSAGLDSLLDMILHGGPVMIPIGLCSIVSLAYIVERFIRLRKHRLGSMQQGEEVLVAVQDGGPRKGLDYCLQKDTPLTRILAAGLKMAGRPFLEVEKAVEDAGMREVKRLSANLRPLVVVAAIAPLLGLLGTVWGMIQAFSNIAVQESLGKPELLASGISQALITTATGLSIAIPTQAAYFFFKSRIDRFVHRVEDFYMAMNESLSNRRAAA
ncbi:MAG: MotA/TolQ/ExbB proton channel family protein [Planctomycetota bacterium]